MVIKGIFAPDFLIHTGFVVEGSLLGARRYGKGRENDCNQASFAAWTDQSVVFRRAYNLSALLFPGLSDRLKTINLFVETVHTKQVIEDYDIIELDALTPANRPLGRWERLD